MRRLIYASTDSRPTMTAADATASLVWSERDDNGIVTHHERLLNRYQLGARLDGAGSAEQVASSFNTLFASFSMTKAEEALMRATMKVLIDAGTGDQMYIVYAGDGAPAHAFDVKIEHHQEDNFPLALELATVAVAFNDTIADIVKSRVVTAPPGCTHWGPWRGDEYEISLHRVIENNQCAVCADDLDADGHCRECCVNLVV